MEKREKKIPVCLRMHPVIKKKIDSIRKKEKRSFGVMVEIMAEYYAKNNPS